MFGSTNHRGNCYYRHNNKKLKRKCDPSLWVQTDRLEEAVLVRLFSTLGDAAGMEAAMSKAIPDAAKVRELREKKTFLESELSKVEARKNRVIESIAEGIISKDEAGKKMEEIRARETSLKSEIEGTDPQLSSVPTEEEIRRKAKLIQRIVGQIYRSPSRLAKMSFEEKRKLVSDFFAGKDSQGRRLGVYVSKDGKGDVHFEIRGAFNQTFTGTFTPEGPDILDLPDMSVEHLEDLKGAVKGKGKNEKQETVSKG